MAIQKQKLAADILEYVGGVDNVRDVAHCMTRLRIVVKDEKAVQLKVLEQLEGVMKVVILGGQYQIVLGGIVDDIFDEVAALCGDRVNINEDMIAENLDADTKGVRRSILGMLVETISAIVTPIIPAMLACGFIKTLAVLFTVVFKVDEANSTIQVLNVVSDTLYAFFPVIIGWSAAKKFKTNMAVSLVIVALLVNYRSVCGWSQCNLSGDSRNGCVLWQFCSSCHPIYLSAIQSRAVAKKTYTGSTAKYLCTLPEYADCISAVDSCNRADWCMGRKSVCFSVYQHV